MNVIAVLELQRVTIGSLEHFFPIGFSIVFAIALILYAKRSSNEKLQKSLFNSLALVVSLTVLLYHLYTFVFETYNVKTDLPLYLCSLMSLLIPVFSYYKRYWMFEVLVFWIIAGTLQGVLTPDIAVGFPSFDYFRYWVVHLGLLIIIFYAIFVFNMKPSFKSIFKSFFALQLYIVLMIFLNFILDANYCYLNRKPESASLLDYFGEWPYYIITAQLIIIPLFIIIYLPFHFKSRNKSL
ncbi:TIGR02206 family membrane protein [uncultured Psychroserpens sp.]|uniref:YwaF family protein n=1 Tax=uncultured Psychroserpens sp. TaxID=255436 RepID=UPI002617CAF3|nr:TIGR02206 family membrane protein [uncultured Psychroserpens sp.]